MYMCSCAYMHVSSVVAVRLEAAASAHITIRHTGSAHASAAAQMSDPTGSAQTDHQRDAVAAVDANFPVHHPWCVFQCSPKQWV